MNSLNEFATAKLRQLEATRLKRSLVTTERQAAGAASRSGRPLISFSCNDYLGLSQDPRVIEAAMTATRRYGAGSGASRLVTGNHPLFEELESLLAAWKGAEQCLVFGSGYLANLGIVPSLAGPGDLILADALSHACLLAGTRLSGAQTRIFRHNDLAHLSELLAEHRAAARHCLILTDGVFSMDGDLAPIADMARLARAHDAWLMTDDAHGLGVLGGGRGSSFIDGVKQDVPLQMGTLSKAVGAYGGYICADAPVIDLLRSRARTLVYSTGLPPATVASAIAALKIIMSEPDRVAAPLAKARRFTAKLGLPRAESSIVPIVLGDAETALQASRRLDTAGFLVTAIRPPTVPDGTARLRVTFSATHHNADIDRLADLIASEILPRRAAE